MKHLGIAFMVLDIETSTLFDEIDGKQVPVTTWLSYGWCKLYDLKGETMQKCYFRKWEGLRKFFVWISSRFCDFDIRCYVHNLGYEFDYLIKNVSRPKKIITNTSHNVISAILEDFPQIQFVCSYQVSGYSLAKIGEMVKLPKLESDYRTIYPDDKITQEEIDYCERDCDIVAVYVTKILLPEFGLLSKIPLTKTGRVRLTLKKFYKYEDSPDWDLMPDEDCYNAMCDAFAGGIVCSNPYFTNRIMKNVYSYDITSSYPFAILSELYPSKITRLYDFDNSVIKKYPCWIAKIRFNNIESKFPWAWLSVSKMNEYSSDCQYFNGKLLEGGYIVRTITNVDFNSICSTYNFDDFEILEFYACENVAPIPKCYIQTVRKYAKRKHELKVKLKKMEMEGLAETEEYSEVERDYMLAKNDFNSIYGMCVQKLVQEEYEIDDLCMWHAKESVYRKSDKHLGRNFLFGIYITAYARANLLRAIVENCPFNFVYCDTDSVKFIGENNFTDTNKLLPDEFLQEPSLKDLGRFDFEGMYRLFKTLGAKKYAFKEFVKKGKEPSKLIYLTVAGLPKKKGKEKGKEESYLSSLDEFTFGKEFKDCKLAKRYLFEEQSIEIGDSEEVLSSISTSYLQHYLKKNKIKTNGGVALYPVSYVLDMTASDKFYLMEIESGLFEMYVRKHRLGQFI